MPVKSGETAFPVFRIGFAPSPDSFHFSRSAPQFPIPRFCKPLFITQSFTSLPTTWSRTKPLVMVVAGIGGEPFFAATTFSAAVFVSHTKHHRLQLYRNDLKIERPRLWRKTSGRNARWFLHPHTGSVPRASIISNATENCPYAELGIRASSKIETLNPDHH